jgi:hypothetical protein
LKPKLSPPLEVDLDVGIDTNEMGVGILGMIMERKDDIVNIPQMEGLDDTGRDGIGPMEIIDGKEDITGMPLVALINELYGSTTLDEKTSDPTWCKVHWTKKRFTKKFPYLDKYRCIKISQRRVGIRWRTLDNHFDFKGQDLFILSIRLFKLFFTYIMSLKRWLDLHDGLKSL